MCSANRTSNESSLPTYCKEIATSLLPIVLMFGVFQLVALKLDRRTLGRIGVGLAYTYIGLVFFLTGANVGFIPAGNYLGQVLAGMDRIEEAASCFCRALQQTTSVQEMIAIAVELSAIGMADQAMHIYFMALLREPDNYYLYSNLGIELAEQREFADAVFCHEKALQMDGENADLWYNAACTYSLMGEAMRGLLALEKAIELDEENRNYAMQDPELEFLQKHKRFWKLVKHTDKP